VSREDALGGLVSLVGDVFKEREMDREDLLSLKPVGEFRNFGLISTGQSPYI
jgi:hypothetical protein